jgi:uncharacterized membrane protein YhaH (DUF805 family)
MEWMLLPLKRYADFSGRSRRKEYWMFFLGYLIAAAVAGAIGALLHMGVILVGLVVVALFVLSLAVQVRRFHDRDQSGWFILLNLIPYVGGLIVLVLMCLEGTRGPNRFGNDPKDDDGDRLSQIFA